MYWFVVMLIFTSVVDTDAKNPSHNAVKCRQRFMVTNERKYLIRSKNGPNSKVGQCAIEFASEADTLIRLEVTFRRSNKTTNCETEYLHIGNYRKLLNSHVVTSYVFCDICTSDEIVSRGNFLWAVYHNANGNHPSLLNISYQAFPRATCNETMFRCSPIQCIPKYQVCDGISQCLNGQDEYCDNTTQGCFRCFNGQCIKPQLTRYSEKWGQKLWYLCDGHRHCDDGTDERKDICYRVRRKSDALIQCVPASATDGNTTQMMWNKVVCDGKDDCLHGEDESDTRCSTVKETQPYDVLPVIIVILAVLLFISGAVLIHFLGKQRQRLSHRRLNRSSLHAWSEMSLSSSVKNHLKSCPHSEPRRPSSSTYLIQIGD